MKITTGKQTQIIPKIKKIANTIKGENMALVVEVFNIIKSMDITTDSTGPDFTRTAAQILEDFKYNGCNEAGVVFDTLLRAKGVSVIYIQALNKKAVQTYSKKRPSLNGHVFLEVDFGKSKKIVNSTTGEITDELPDNMIVGAKGLDSWDIGLKNGFSDLQKLFEEKI